MHSAPNIHADKIARNLFFLILVYVATFAGSIWLFIGGLTPPR